MLIIHYSNRAENLAQVLTEILHIPQQRTLAEDIVVVQSLGMARWLSMYIADQLGICANIRFPFPTAYTWEVLRLLLGKNNVPEITRFDKPVLTWRLLTALQQLDDSPTFAELNRYLHHNNVNSAGASITDDGYDDDFRCYQLAQRIADVYDHYLVYRPDWIEDWEQNRSQQLSSLANSNTYQWQAALWRRLTDFDNAHRVTFQRRFWQALETLTLANSTQDISLPERIAVMGISALPPSQLNMLLGLSKLLDVHLFLLNPCQEYWGDIVADRDIARQDIELDPAEHYLTVGNPLLASLGKQGRDFIDLLQSYPATLKEYEYYETPTGNTLLHYLQTDILELRRRGEDSAKTRIATDDYSIQIHTCHSPQREVEVLHDQLLALFSRHHDLKPADVIVMTPDIDTYSPHIEAVFDVIKDQRRIPYTIADRQPSSENPLLEAVLALLDLPRSRFQANRLLALLEYPAIQRRFELNSGDLQRIHYWVKHTGIRWGIDRESRAKLSLPATHEHTWQSGLERMLLGYALAKEDVIYEQILPYLDIEGSDALIMGRWQHFINQTLSLTQLTPRSFAAWQETIINILHTFFSAADSSEEHQLQLIRDAIMAFTQHVQLAEFDQPISLQVFKTSLQQQLSASSGMSGFFAGGVTFCTLVPMRSIPFRIVCLIGMNSDSYPRPQQHADFDLLTKYFRKGDRSRRQDDRYLFLEAILSVRDYLYLSYVGNDIRDNSIIPPAVLVSELLDVIAAGFTVADKQTTIRDHVVTRHPLQAFSSRYFDNSDQRLFSYSQELADNSRQAAQQRQDPPSFVNSALPITDTSWQQVQLTQLHEFFRNPASYWLRHRLAIQLASGTDILLDHEPFVLDGLDSYRLRCDLLELHLQNHTSVHAQALLRGGGRLPHGQVGENIFEREWRGVELFAKRLQRFLPKRFLEPIDTEHTLADWQLYGRLEQLIEQGYFGYRFGKISPHDYLQLWLQHLLLNLTAPTGINPISHWLGQDQEVILQPMTAPQAQKYLTTLLELYWQGLSQPLRFFPKSAFAYQDALRNKKSRTPAAIKARQTWEGNDLYPGEADDPYYQLAFRGQQPLDATFEALSITILDPLYEHLETPP